MTLNVHYVSSYCMNLSPLLVGIHFVALVCIRLWTMVCLVFFYLSLPLSFKTLKSHVVSRQATSVLCAGQSYLLAQEHIPSGNVHFVIITLSIIKCFFSCFVVPQHFWSLVDQNTSLAFLITVNSLFQRDLKQYYTEKLSRRICRKEVWARKLDALRSWYNASFCHGCCPPMSKVVTEYIWTSLSANGMYFFRLFIL